MLHHVCDVIYDENMCGGAGGGWGGGVFGGGGYNAVATPLTQNRLAVYSSPS